MNNDYHSVKLIDDKCIGCTDCIKRCPTEAIRVRNGKAVILHERCIDCGMCIKICRNHAKRAATEPLSAIKEFKYKVAIPAPTLYSQYKDILNVNIILTALKQLGFDEVYEVAYAAALTTAETEKLIKSKEMKKPIISTACPAIVRLITMRFPDLIENLLPLISPMETMARLTKDHLVSTGIKREEIGVFFITPCAAKHTDYLSPQGIEKSEVDGTISISDIYMPLRNKIKSLDFADIEILAHSTHNGVDWAITGGESKCINIDSIAVDGVENVIKVLEEIENGQLDEVDFIEGLACTGGCIGGPLTIVNTFVAKNNLRKYEAFMKREGALKTRRIDFKPENIDYNFTKEIQPVSALKLDENMAVALAKLEEINRISVDLPDIDCGACGAPTCEALAEDIVKGHANPEDCVFMLRSKVKLMAESMFELASKLPQTTRQADENKEI